MMNQFMMRMMKCHFNSIHPSISLKECGWMDEKFQQQDVSTMFQPKKKRESELNLTPSFSGGNNWIRTSDPLLVRQVL